MPGNKNDGHDDLNFDDFQFENDLSGDNTGDDGVFELEDMPVAGKPPAAEPPRGRTVLAKPIEDEFEDDALDETATGGDFGGGFDDDFADAEPPPPVAGRSRASVSAMDTDSFGGEDDNFADVHDRVNDRDDAFAEDVQEGEDEEVVYEEPRDTGSLVSKYGIYAGIGLAVLLVGGLAYTTVLPMFAGPSQDAPPPLMTSAIENVPVGPAPSLPGAGAPVLPSGVDPAPTLPAPTLPGVGPGPATTGAPVLPGPAQDTGLVTDAPVATGLALDSPAPMPAAGDVAARVDRIESELDMLSRAELVDKVASLEQRLNALESRPAAETPSPVVSPPSKPQVIEDWALKGVQGGVAWIEGPPGFLEVRAGSDIPGVGKVTEVTTYENDWLVVTTAGVIMQN